MKLFLDESGYTGEDLINVDQPWFVLASTILGDDEAKALSQDIFKGVKAQELKHSKLRRTWNGQERVAEYIKALKQCPNKVGTSVALKKYVLVTMLVEWWVEPYFHQDGINLYERGANLGMCNLMYITFGSVGGSSFFDSALSSFQEMMRDRTPQTYNAFWRVINLHFNSAPDQALKEVLTWLLYGERRLGYRHLIELPKRVMDIPLPTAVETVNHWRKQSMEPFEVIHDESSSMAKDKWLWDQLTNPAITTATVGCDRHLLSFPLGVASTEFRRSTDVLQLQLADIIAGSTAEWCDSKHTETRSPYTDLLEKAGIADLVFGGIWPSAQVTPEELGTDGENLGNILDFVSSKIEIPDEFKSHS